MSHVSCVFGLSILDCPLGWTNWLQRRRGGIIIRRNGAKTISLQTSFGDLIIIRRRGRNGAKTISP
jgi:hypothetical protein